MVELEVLGVSGERYQPVVFLRHEDRVLPIVVGISEADAIITGLTKKNIGRPMTHDLICNVLAGLGGQVRSMTIYKLEEATFYAHLNVEQCDENEEVVQVLRIDSRPSDGIAVAVRLEVPIFASEAVMDQASQDVSLLSANEEEEDEEGNGEPEEPEFDA
jgi:uncharacterized protein